MLSTASPAQPSHRMAHTSRPGSLTCLHFRTSSAIAPDTLISGAQTIMHGTKVCLQDTDMVVLGSLEHLFYLPTDFALVPNQGYNGWAYNAGSARVCCMPVCP